MHNRRRHNKVEFRGNRNLRRCSISTGISRSLRRSRSTKQTLCECVCVCVYVRVSGCACVCVRVVKFILYNSQLPRYDFRCASFFFLISQLKERERETLREREKEKQCLLIVKNFRRQNKQNMRSTNAINTKCRTKGEQKTLPQCRKSILNFHTTQDKMAKFRFVSFFAYFLWFINYILLLLLLLVVHVQERQTKEFTKCRCNIKYCHRHSVCSTLCVCLCVCAATSATLLQSPSPLPSLLTSPSALFALFALFAQKPLIVLRATTTTTIRQQIQWRRRRCRNIFEHSFMRRFSVSRDFVHSS